MSKGNLPEVLSQAILAGRFLVGRFGAGALPEAVNINIPDVRAMPTFGWSFPRHTALGFS